ncbi:MAG: monooxygenase [Deltaproteobacteria bacterium]
MRPLLVAFAAIALVACRGGAGGADAGPDGGLQADAVFYAGPFTVDAGSEIVMCSFVRAPNDAPADVQTLVSEQSVGGHHLIAYTVNHPIDLPPTPCSQGGQPGWDYIYGTQDPSDHWQLPPGVGFHLEPHQQLVLETHFINATPNPQTVQSGFGFDFAPAGSVTTRASVFYFGTENLNLPRYAQSQVDAYCSPPQATTLHTVVGHQHRFGTGVTVGYVPKGGAEQPLYQTTNWDSPPMLTLDGGLTVSPGDQIHVSCGYDNTTAGPITFPTEMCFAVGAYWPSQGLLFCASGGGSSECGCGYGTPIDAGPGGSGVTVVVSRQDSIAGVSGDPSQGEPIYCALYRAADWAGVQPAAGAEAMYVAYETGTALATPKSTATLSFVDVTPGDYVATCFMDTIAGGSYPGKGDPTNLAGAQVTAVAAQTTTVDTTLDYAIP